MFLSVCSSSCSCDSCCPSSPCSSSLSPAVTYETDTSHASTPSEATPLTLDVTMETIAAAASCLEANEARVASVAVDIEDGECVRAQEPPATDSSLPIQTVTVPVIAMAASSQPSPGSEIALTVRASPPVDVQLELPPCSPILSAGSSSTLPSPRIDATQLPSTEAKRTGSPSEPPTPTARCEALETPDLSRTFEPPSVPPIPIIPFPDVRRTMAFKEDSASLLNSDQDSRVTPTQTMVSTDPTMDQDPRLSEFTPPNPTTVSVPNPVVNAPAVPKPTRLNLTPGTITATVSSPLTQHLGPSPGSGLIRNPQSPGSSQHSSVVLTVAGPGKSPGPRGSSKSNLLAPMPSDVEGSGSPSTLTCPVPVDKASSCPAITIESETSFASSPSPLAVVSPSSPRSPLGLAAPVLLLDPLAALHPSDRGAGGGSSSGHASSLSPSPRATQSPPKQTVFSPCVDVFEPGPACWEDGDEEQDDCDREEEEDEDMGADESQYRHRRLTGDSGIEVCRCRVEEEEDDDEEEAEEEKNGNGDVHDSLDCPARSQTSAGDELTPCSAPISVAAAPTPEENGKVIVVMETV